MFDQIRADVEAYRQLHALDRRLKTTLFLLVCYNSANLLLLVRFRSFLHKYRIPVVGRLVYLIQLGLFGADIDVSVHIGTGVVFTHTVGLVIGGDSYVGDGCIFNGSNTLGNNNGNGYPRLEKGVVLGAGARVIGGIVIGEKAVVGANAVVTKDVPAGRTVVGANNILPLKS